MNLLLDTHALLWWLADQPTLAPEAREAIATGENLVFVSAVVIWEIRIKQALGKLKIPPEFKQVLDAQPFEKLAISAEHANAVAELPDIHRDPFDRMLVAQAKVEGFALVSRDLVFARYGIAVISA